MKNHQQFKEICIANGWKCTSQRLAVYDFICNNHTHPGVDEAWSAVKETLPTVTRESVYRILNEFTQAGLLQRLDHIDSARYDGETQPHGHFICEVCGSITDFALPDGLDKVNHPVAGQIRYIELRISGICPNCNKNQ